jgi:hypothetical protein
VFVKNYVIKLPSPILSGCVIGVVVLVLICPFSWQMEDEGWTTVRCEQVPYFPKMLWEACMRLGYTKRPEYTGREYEECGSQMCEVYLQVFDCSRDVSLQPWRVHTVGVRFTDTYQLAARQALQHLCGIHVREVTRGPMRHLPANAGQYAAWCARMSAMEDSGRGDVEDDTTAVVTAQYVHAQEHLYDDYYRLFKGARQRAMESEIRERALRILLDEARVQAAAAEDTVVRYREGWQRAVRAHTRDLNRGHAMSGSRTRTTARKSTYRLPVSRTQDVFIAGVPLLPARVAEAIADGRVGPFPVPAATGGLAPAEPIQDGDIELPVDGSEEEDPSERELVDDDNDFDINGGTGLAITSTPARTYSPTESAVGSTADRSPSDT